MLEYTRNLLCIWDLCKSVQFVQLECRNLHPWVIVAAIAVRHTSVWCWGRTLFWWVQCKHEPIRSMGPLKHGQPIKTEHWMINFFSSVRSEILHFFFYEGWIFFFVPKIGKKTKKNHSESWMFLRVIFMFGGCIHRRKSTHFNFEKAFLYLNVVLQLY